MYKRMPNAPKCMNTCKKIHNRTLNARKRMKNSPKHTQKCTQTHLKNLLTILKFHTNANAFTRIQKYINVFM